MNATLTRLTCLRTGLYAGLPVVLSGALWMTAVPAGAAEMFAQGWSQFSLRGGAAQAFRDNYFTMGASASYYLKDGVGAGVSVEQWNRDGTGITRYTAFGQYVHYRDLMVPWYAGGFYRRSAMDMLPSISSLGARAGVMLAAGQTTFFIAGFVYETYLGCEKSIYRSCREFYPELNLNVAF